MSTGLKGWDSEDFGGLAIALVIVCAVLVVAWVVVAAIRADGHIEFCRVQYDNHSTTHPPIYVVVGYRRWREDVNVATAPTADEADAKRKALCP